MALAEQIKAETSSQKAANMPLDSLLVTTPPIIETKTSWGSVILAFIAGIAVAGSVGYSFVVEPLQQAVSFQADQKLTYMSQNRIDQSTFEPRIRALEMSNAAKAEKETVLMNTVEDLQAELAKYKNVSK